MTMTVEHEIVGAIASLKHLETICQAILNVETGLPADALLCPIDAPNITLRDAIDYCWDTLTSQLIHIEQGEAAEHLSYTFSQVAHNLEPLLLRDAIQSLHSTVEKLVILEQTLVRLKVEARLTISNQLPLYAHTRSPQSCPESRPETPAP